MSVDDYQDRECPLILGSYHCPRRTDSRSTLLAPGPTLSLSLPLFECPPSPSDLDLILGRTHRRKVNRNVTDSGFENTFSRETRTHGPPGPVPKLDELEVTFRVETDTETTEGKRPRLVV